MTNAAIIALDADTAHAADYHVNGHYAPIDIVEGELAMCLDGFAGGLPRARFILRHLIRLGGDATAIAIATAALR